MSAHTSSSAWRQQAEQIVAQALREAREQGLDAKATRKHVSKAYPCPPRKHHPYKIWCSVVREMLPPTPGKLKPCKSEDWRENLDWGLENLVRLGLTAAEACKRLQEIRIGDVDGIRQVIQREQEGCA